MIKFKLHIINEDAGQDSIIKFFRKNPAPSDDEVHALAQKLGIDKHEFESQIYATLGNILQNIGKHRDADPGSYSEEELAMGVQIEKEHTDLDWVAREIAKDHLAEDSAYYTHLKEMESKYANQGGA